jgi:thioesterase domain-containing protein
MRQSFKNQIRYIADRVKHRLANKTKMSLCTLYRVIRRPIPHGLRYWYVEQKNIKPLFSYDARQYSGSLTLFSGYNSQDGSDIDFDKGWRHYIDGEIKIIKIPANHHEFVEDPRLSQTLKVSLAEAQENCQECYRGLNINLANK